jgi:tetratricopeptide (TPR) repeat protein
MGIWDGPCEIATSNQRCAFEEERLAKIGEQETRTESKTQLVEQIHSSLRSGDYSRALDLVRGTAAKFPDHAELAELEMRALDGVKRIGEANRLITESQDLFAQQKSAQAIQLLRKAYELDKHNSLARTILANALVEHAHSMVESDWLEAETLTNQALNLNPAHPTAKTIRTLIVEKKTTSSVDDWVAHARKRQSSGDLFAALAWVAEGLAVHPDDSKLLQVQDEIQRDQGARRRQARRGDLEDLRRMEQEINKTADPAAKQALAERIQMVAAKYWTDGEILSIANALLLRLGLVPKGGAPGSPQKKGATVIFHVPRPTAPEASPTTPNQVSTSHVSANPVVPNSIPKPVAANPLQSSPEVPSQNLTGKPSTPKAPIMSAPPLNVPAAIAPPRQRPSSSAPPVPVPTPSPEPQLFSAQLSAPQAAVAAADPVAPAEAPARSSPPASPRKQAPRSNSTTLILACTAAVILVAAIFFFARKHAAAPVVKTPAAPSAEAPANSTAAPTTITETSIPDNPRPALPPSSDEPHAKATLNAQPPAAPAPATAIAPVESAHNLGTLLVVAGQDDAKVFLDGKLQRQLTQGGQLRLPNLEVKDYVVQVSKGGFQDPPQQKIHIRGGEQAGLVFNLQPLPHLASLTIQAGAPGTMVLLDRTPVGTIQPDGTLSVSTVSPGDHTVELRKDRFKPRQFQEHFVAGSAVALAAADATLEAAPGELKITFAPADAKVAIAKTGELPTMVSSGVPLNLAAGTYTLTARTAERFTRSSTFEIAAGQSKTFDLSLAPNGMSKWEDPGAWKHEGDSFLRQGGDFVLYGVVPSSGSFAFSATVTKGRLLQWVFNYADSKNYVLFQMDDNNFYRTVVRNGQKTDEIIVPDKSDKKNSRTLHIRVSPTEIVHQVGHGDSWRVLDRWTQPGANLSLGKFGLYLPANDQVALSGFAYYPDLNLR